ncbi:PREDICTED: non-secretory ribonuclease-like [Propithecus coquereli]|uniref:non-secretory ribonuclease-like n=1 Tax=Propithecus coquereli TaxID=379532 RepID=UPI00063F2D42|nr:PREDICTED: non-secretory ribonuclease-like [Propithecus coquereli]
MVPKLLHSRLCLLLLLGLMGMVGSFHARPADLTWAQWFQIQHINMTHARCNNAMLVVNGYTGRCKGRNTFLNTTYADVVNVCGTPNTTCPTSKSTNCHNSSVQVPLTYCNLTSRPTPIENCRYAQTPAWKFYIVACDRRSPRDTPTYPVVPVHLDAIF